MLTQWSTTDKASSLTVSSDGLTAGNTTTAWGSCRGTNGKATGKWYFELTTSYPNPAYAYGGIATASHDLTQMVGYYNTGWSLKPGTGQKFHALALNNCLGVLPSGGTLRVAVDVDEGHVWFGSETGWAGGGTPGDDATPAYTNVAGTVFPAASPFGTATTILGRFVPASLLYDAPAGFSAWDFIASISGIITDCLGQPCQRKVYAVSRPTDTTAPVILAHGLSDPTTGAYELVLSSTDEVTRVVVSEDDDPLLNDLVHRVIPG
jgi:hypothetical protein